MVLKGWRGKMQSAALGEWRGVCPLASKQLHTHSHPDNTLSAFSCHMQTHNTHSELCNDSKTRLSWMPSQEDEKMQMWSSHRGGATPTVGKVDDCKVVPHLHKLHSTVEFDVLLSPSRRGQLTAQPRSQGRGTRRVGRWQPPPLA